MVTKTVAPIEDTGAPPVEDRDVKPPPPKEDRDVKPPSRKARRERREKREREKQRKVAQEKQRAQEISDVAAIEEVRREVPLPEVVEAQRVKEMARHNRNRRAG